MPAMPESLLYVRSFAVAMFLVAKGTTPLSATIRDGKPVWGFPPAAQELMRGYIPARELLNSLVAQAEAQAQESAKPRDPAVTALSQ